MTGGRGQHPSPCTRWSSDLAGFALGFVADYRRAFFGMASDNVAMADAATTHDPCDDGVWHVLPGDTMWAIAATCYPDGHTGQMVAAIRAANPSIDPGRMRYGDILILPEGSK